MRDPGTTELRGRSWRGGAPERLYLWLAIPFGLVFVFFNPPFRGVPDELVHYRKSLVLATGEFSMHGVAPRNYVDLAHALEPERTGKRRDAKVDGDKVRASLTGGPSAERVEFTAPVGYAWPFGYLPQAVGLWLALLIRAPPLVAFFLGRLLAFAVAACALFFAIRLAPFGKRAFLLVGLLPGTLSQMASFSRDSLYLGAMFLFTAHVLALTQRSRLLTRPERCQAIVISLASSLTKPGFALMSLLVFLLPRRLFRSPRSHAWFTGSVVLANFVLFALGRILLDEGPTGLSQVDPRAQLAHVLTRPTAFANAIGHALLEHGDDFLRSVIFPASGREGIFSPWLYAFVGLGLVLCLRSQDEVVQLSRAQRIVLLCTAAAQALLVFLSLYLFSTPVGQGVVLGMQGRYFLVLLPLLVFAFQGSGFAWQSEWIRRHPRAALLTFTLAVLGYVVLRLGIHYY